MIDEASLNFFRQQLLFWFERNGRKFPWRKKNISNYQRIASEILLQRTRAETVSEFYCSFFEIFPSWKALGTASEEQIGDVIRPIGLWRRRSRGLKALGEKMAKRNGHFPHTRKEIEMLPAVGQYIANAILLFCYDKAEPLLDVNMARVLERYFGPRKLADIRYDQGLQNLARRFVSYPNPRHTNWAILDYAALVCKQRNPLCCSCILNKGCLYYKSLPKSPESLH